MASSASPACDELAMAAERRPADTTVGSHVMRTMTCLLLALVTSTVLVVAPPAGAATVSIVRQDDEGSGGDDQSSGASRTYTLSYATALGEENDVTLAATAEAITVAEATLGVTAGIGCVALDPHTVRCATPAPSGDVTLNRVGSIDLGEGQDRFVFGSLVGGAFISVLGGPGNDQLSGPATGKQAAALQGGAGDDSIIGGQGDDRLGGDSGRDSITGGGGDDTIQGGADGDDLVGGAGRDELDYADHTSRVVVDLGLSQGGASEGDTIAGFENVRGGKGNDTLRGSSRANALVGGPGTDTLYGRAGNDSLDGERVSGGSGNDEIGGISATPDCGPGRDLVGGVYALPGPRTLLPAQCERVSVDASVEMTTHLRRVRGALCFTVFSNVSPARTVRVTVHDARTRTLLAKGRARIPGRCAALAARAYVCRPPHATARSAAPAEGHLQRPRLRDQLDLWVTRIAEPLRFHTS